MNKESFPNTVKCPQKRITPVEGHCSGSSISQSSKSPDELIKTEVCRTRLSDSEVLGCVQRICIFNKFPVDIKLLVQGRSLRKPALDNHLKAHLQV